MGKLIVIEGSCDGVGKSTQYKLLIERLKKENIHVTTHHFPSYGTYQGRAVEEYLKGNFGKISELSPYFVNSLYAQDRAITWNNCLKEIYNNEGIIILDRYTTSSLIYQSSVIENIEERKQFINYIYDYEYHKLGIPEPDLVIFLHAPFELVRELKNKRKDNERIKNDIHESDIEFMKNVSDTSISIANKFNWCYIECMENGKMRPIENIHEDIYIKVTEII